MKCISCCVCFTYLFSNVGIYCIASETILVISGWSCQYGYLISGILDILHNIYDFTTFIAEFNPNNELNTFLVLF